MHFRLFYLQSINKMHSFLFMIVQYARSTSARTVRIHKNDYCFSFIAVCIVLCLAVHEFQSKLTQKIYILMAKYMFT